VEHLDEVEVDLIYFPFILTAKSRDEIYELSQERTVPFKPNQEDRWCIRIEWSMVSNAAERSRRQSSEFLLSHGLDDVVMNRMKRGFSRMVGCVSRLKRV